MKRIAKVIALSLPVVIVTLLFAAGATRAATEDEVKALFGEFVAAQSAHDLKAVKHGQPGFELLERQEQIQERRPKSINGNSHHAKWLRQRPSAFGRVLAAAGASSSR
jgi:hypothetical protein